MIIRYLKTIKKILQSPAIILNKMESIQEALGRIEARQIASSNLSSINESEFKVYSQWGEDGIIQYLINKIEIVNKVFVEFGVENYTESNTRFLLKNNSWSGLIIDGSENNIDYIKTDTIYWSNNLKAVCTFITKDNINKIITENGINGDIGLLSIDIDGNDYWIWDAIDCVNPRIIICEYQGLFGSKAEVVVPYQEKFVRDNAHYSKVYYGASICALKELASKRSYSLVASNSAGNNAFFVRNDLVGNLKVLSPREAYRDTQFREFHDVDGNLTFDSFNTRLSKIKHLEVVNLKTNRVTRIGDIEEMFE